MARASAWPRAFGSLAFVGLTYFLLRPHFGIDLPARGVVVLELLLSTFLMTAGALRAAPRVDVPRRP